MERASAGFQNAKNIAIELHHLLKQAGEKEPCVLVAASVAWFCARQYVDAYPTEVASLVLVDSSTPEQMAQIPRFESSPELIKRQHLEARPEQWREANRWALLSGGCKPEVEPELEVYANVVRSEACRPAYAMS